MPSMKCRYCYRGSLNEGEVTGKIVLCDQLTDGVGPFVANALGTIMQDGGWSDTAFSFPLPATVVGLDSGSQVLKYINTTRCVSTPFYFLGSNSYTLTLMT